MAAFRGPLQCQECMKLAPRYCSIRCYKREWKRRSLGWQPPQPRGCVICFSQFTPDVFHPRAQTCSPKCSAKLEYRNHRAAYLEQAKRYRLNNREHFNRYLREYRKKHLIEAKARSLVRTALRAGKIKRPRHCLLCGKKTKPEAHHFNGYDKPLDVLWVCKRCHQNLHGHGTAA